MPRRPRPDLPAADLPRQRRARRLRHARARAGARAVPACPTWPIAPSTPPGSSWPPCRSSPTPCRRPTRPSCAAASAPGDLAVWVGVGGVGGFGVQIAAALGAHVVAIDVDDARLAQMAPHGAALTLELGHGRREGRCASRCASFADARGIPSWRMQDLRDLGHPAGQATAFGLLGHGGLPVGRRLHAEARRGAALEPDGVRRHRAGQLGLSARALPRGRRPGAVGPHRARALHRAPAARRRSTTSSRAAPGSARGRIVLIPEAEP